MKTQSESALKRPAASARQRAAAARVTARAETRGTAPRRLFETHADPLDAGARRNGTTGRRQWSRFAGCLLLAAASTFAAAPARTNAPPREPSPPARPDFSAFNVILQRNIFNTYRSGPNRRDRVDYFTLVGTMTFDEGDPLAVFDGSSSDYGKVLSPGTLIAGFKVLSVDTKGAKIDVNGETVDLPVFYQMRRVNGGPWRKELATQNTVASATPSVESSRAMNDFGFGNGRGNRRMNFNMGQPGDFQSFDSQGDRRQRGGRGGGRGGRGGRGGGGGFGGGGFGGGGFGGGGFGGDMGGGFGAAFGGDTGGGFDFGSGGASAMNPGSTPAASSAAPDQSVVQRLMQQRQAELSGGQTGN